MPFLRRLYEDSRAEERAMAAWPDAMMAPFLDSQFALQHTHYVTHFPDTDFLIVERRGNAIGRFYVDDRGENLHVVDITLLIDEQGKGHGEALMRAAMAQAARDGQGVSLQVSRANPRAGAFYRRLGFHVSAETDSHLAMRWVS
ncbi:MAG: GNAT family N-acetyltransferase [Luteibacter sp.]